MNLPNDTCILVPPAIKPAPIICSEKITCICVAMAAPEEIPDTEIWDWSTLYSSKRLKTGC